MKNNSNWLKNIIAASTFFIFSAAVNAIDVPATAEWVDTGFEVHIGDGLEIQATGSWTDGNATTGPDGAAQPWPDNFLNLEDLGVCAVCARKLTKHHGALIAYIGDSPPAPGSYTSIDVRPEASKIFYVGSQFRGNAPNSGRLWLNKNADAYSGYTIDNTGEVIATVSMFPGEQPGNFARFLIPGACVAELVVGTLKMHTLGTFYALQSHACQLMFHEAGVEGVALLQCVTYYERFYGTDGAIRTCITGEID